MPRFINSMTMPKRLYLYLLPTVMVACLTVSAVFYQSMSQSMDAENRERVQSVSREADQRVQEYLKSSQSDADVFAATPEPKTLLQPNGYAVGIEAQSRAINSFRMLQTAKTSYRELFILNSQGHLLMSHADDPFYLAEKDLHWLEAMVLSQKDKSALELKFMLTDTQNGRRLSILSPIHHPDMTTMGWIVLSQDLRVFHSLSEGSGSMVSYMDAEGHPLHELHPHAAELLLLHKQATADDATYRLGDNQWAIHRALSNFGEIVVFRDASEQLEQLSWLRQQTAWLTLGFTLLFSLLIWWLISSMVLRPLKTLSVAATSIADGTYHENSIHVRNDEIGSLWSSILSMATNIKKSSHRNHMLAYYDDLTGLHNKQAFLEHIRQFTDTVSTMDVAIWVVDLDNFKQLNDIHGYHVGNNILRAVASRLEDAAEHFSVKYKLQQSQFMVARASGDEYLIFGRFQPNCPTDIANLFAQHLVTQVNQPFSMGTQQYHVGCYVGWAQSGNSGFEIYEKADMAMHEAKKTKSCVVEFNAELLERARRNQELSESIKRALANDTFTLHYQPKCDVKSPHAIVEYEALIRWPTETGMVSPAVFIPFAEDVGLIGAIDAWVGCKVLLDIQRMENAGMSEFCVSFNVSAERLSDRTFTGGLMQQVQLLGVNPSHLQIEITEHSLIENMQESMKAILELKTFGISVALDDFGTGHSSLGYLKDLPVSALKIDRCFVQDTDLDLQKQTLLKHIIAIGKGLGMQVVAEGVETDGELRVLQELECDLAQGYLLHRPMPLQSVLSLRSKLAA